METKIILAFQGCGKSYVTENNKNLKCKDMDFKYYRGKNNWEEEYIEILKQNLGHYDYIFCNISEEIMQLLRKNCLEFYVVSPVWRNDNERLSYGFQKLKSIMFGRYVLRKVQTPDNVKWLNRIKRHYDEWTAEDFFTKYTPASHIIPLTAEKDTLASVLERNFLDMNA